LRPDPASRCQPDGVHGRSKVTDPGFDWTDSGWRGCSLRDLVIYEMHTGTATPRGTFDAFIDRLPYLVTLGIKAIEIMPVADFPGEHNWGYDGVSLYAPSRAYGGPSALKRLVDAAHGHGLAVVLDVVYNHLGPDGNYLRDFSRGYFTDRVKTPWGDALDYTRRQVRDFLAWNALYWMREYHVDGFRFDATHAVHDPSDEHILAELARRIREAVPEGRHFALIAEDDRNLSWLLESPAQGGVGMDGVWADDLHHVIRVALSGDRDGYYADYKGTAKEIARTLNQGWLYTGQRSRFWGTMRGTDPSGIEPEAFVYCIQNHDQIGNRPRGDRLNHDVDPAAYRAASALLLLSPGTPLLFQGQEWAATTPFLYFTDHEPELGRLVTEGRRREFARFRGFKAADIPDPQARDTFEASHLQWDEIRKPAHSQVLELYRELLSLRETEPALVRRRRATHECKPVGAKAVALRYRTPGGKDDVLVVANLQGALSVDLGASELTRPPEGCRWMPLISSEELRFGGSHPAEELCPTLDRATVEADGPVVLALKAARLDAEM
ncbi:MAG TPA: malto-oligosyltrehalose trehalohydrolase, partial [Chloroflexia bacterium]|nr:malto-oligosyltrehalose trehalohydrolase [Chloroflexia bacterium]